MTDEIIISVRNLVTEYENRRILDGVNVDIHKGEKLVILGGSGCGKTTLLKHIIGLLHPVKGSIKVLDQEMVDIEEVTYDKLLRQIGVLFQNGALLNSMPVSENIALPLRQHAKLPESIIQKLVRLKLHLVELDHAYDLLPSQLSGGMRKRAALARAIALDPPLLFADEPSAGLDPITSHALDELIIKLNTQLKITFVIVTHELASIHRIADRIIFLDKGKVIFLGPIEDAKNANIPMIDEFFAKGVIT